MQPSERLESFNAHWVSDNLALHQRPLWAHTPLGSLDEKKLPPAN